MRKPVVDYRTFRLSKINEPQFKHLLYLLGWLGYFALYFITERLIPYDKCYSVAFVKQHSVIDIVAAIPLCIFAEWIAFRKYYQKKKEGETYI